MLDHKDNTEDNREMMREVAKEVTISAARYGVAGTPPPVILGGVALALVAMARGLNVDKEALKRVLDANVETVYNEPTFDPDNMPTMQ